MGIAKSLRKAGNLKETGDNLAAIGSILEANRKKKEREQLYNTVGEIFNNYQNKQRQIPNVGAVDMDNLSFSEAEPTQTQIGQETVQEPGMTDFVLPDATMPKDRYNQSQGNFDELINAIGPMLMNPNLEDKDLSRINALSGLAERQTERMKPKVPTYSQEDPFKRTIEFDPETGERKVIQEAQEKEKTPGNIYERVETFNVGGKPIKRGLRKDTGEWEDIGDAYYKSNITNINMPPEYGKLLGDVNKGIKIVEAIKDKWEKDGDLYYPTPDSKYHKTNKEGQTIGYNEKEYKAIKEGEKANYLASAIQLINEQGLDNAVEIIRGGISKGKPFDEVIKEFKKANSEFNKEDERIVRDYFKLMSL